MSQTDRFFHRLAVVFLLVGAVLRLLIWWQNRTLFIDEANLIRNFIEKPTAALFSQLDYGQFCPPLFSILEKTMLSVFGISERVGRFVPLVTSLAALPLAWRLGRRWLSPLGLAAFSLFVAFEGAFLHHGTEIKQYSTDCFIALALLEAAQVVDFQRFKFSWAVVGAVVVWFSMPSAFILASIGCWLGWQFFSEKRWAALAQFCLVAAVWVSSFAVYFFRILKSNIENDGLRVSHLFLKFPPTSRLDFQNWWNAVAGLSNWTVGFTVVSYVVFFGGIAAGAWAFFQRKRADCMLVVLPIVFCFAATAAGVYSMVERLWTFALPLMLLWLAIGWDVFLKPKMSPNSLIFNRLARGAVVVFLLISAAAQLKYDYFIRPFQIEEFRTGFDFIEKNHRPADRFYIHHDAAPVAFFYFFLNDQKFDFGKTPTLAEWRDEPNFYQTDLQNLRKNAPPEAKIWLVWDSKLSPAEQSFLEKMGKLRLETGFRGGQVWSLVPKNRD